MFLKDKMEARFVNSDFKNNSIFELSHKVNRDNCSYPYYLTREKFKQHGFALNTADLTSDERAAFDLHLNVQKPRNSKNCYLLMLETSQVFPANGALSNWQQYRKIFTWNDDLVDNKKFIKINFPNNVSVHTEYGFKNRIHFCSLISSNKTLSTNDKSNLYPERVKAIRWFEKNAPLDFKLFGIGWDKPVLHRGIVGKIERYTLDAFKKFMPLRPFPSYVGQIEKKSEVLTRSRFSICYENVRDLPGYVTEKIFDCFFAGCVPVYWGAINIADYVPTNCFIDRRKFRDMSELYDFLKSITEEEYEEYQQRIATFLSSDAMYPFSAQFFSETIVNKIVQDFGTQP